MTGQFDEVLQRRCLDPVAGIWVGETGGKLTLVAFIDSEVSRFHLRYSSRYFSIAPRRPSLLSTSPARTCSIFAMRSGSLLVLSFMSNPYLDTARKILHAKRQHFQKARSERVKNDQLLIGYRQGMTLPQQDEI